MAKYVITKMENNKPKYWFRQSGKFSNRGKLKVWKTKDGAICKKLQLQLAGYNTEHIEVIKL